MWQANEKLIGIAIAIAIHLAAIWGLLQLDIVRRQLIEIVPIMVTFINPSPITIPAITVRPRPTEQPTPTPARRKTIEPPPPITAKASEMPAPHEAPAVSERPEPLAVVTEAPPPPIVSTVASTFSAPVALPQFNAAYLENPPPSYPPQSKRRHEEGTVLLRVYVSASGLPEKIELNMSSGWPRLDQAALDTVRNWRFVPANQGGKPVTAWVNVPINFSLEDKPRES